MHDNACRARGFIQHEGREERDTRAGHSLLAARWSDGRDTHSVHTPSATEQTTYLADELKTASVRPKDLKKIAILVLSWIGRGGGGPGDGGQVTVLLTTRAMVVDSAIVQGRSAPRIGKRDGRE